MSKAIARALYRKNLGVLARAYRSARETLDTLADLPIRDMDVAALTPEQCCYLDITRTIERDVTAFENLSSDQTRRLNDSARYFLNGLDGHTAANDLLRCSPEFELASAVRLVSMQHQMQKAA